jgi:hypothetical protein
MKKMKRTKTTNVKPKRRLSREENKKNQLRQKVNQDTDAAGKGACETGKR